MHSDPEKVSAHQRQPDIRARAQHAERGAILNTPLPCVFTWSTKLPVSGEEALSTFSGSLCISYASGLLEINVPKQTR